MPRQTEPNVRWKLLATHPLLTNIADGAAQAVGVSFHVVHATDGNWRQSRIGGRQPPLPEFCRMMHSSSEGGSPCRLCHVLMAVAASNHGPVEQRCHAGALVYIVPGPGVGSDSLAVVTSCTFSDEDAWGIARKRGQRLGLDLAALRKAYLALPRLDDARKALLRHCMISIQQALELVCENAALKARVAQEQLPGPPLEALLTAPQWRAQAAEEGPSDEPLLVRVVRELVRQRPELPLTVKQLAEAAHVTPNHFTALFSKHVGVSFVDYLTAARIDRARQLLLDPTLNIGEVARQVGYDDAGYFARRFRQRTGHTPRAWRDGAGSVTSTL